MLQIGGDDPAEMAECAKIAEDYGYDGVNINVGCPSGTGAKRQFWRVFDEHAGCG